MTTSLDNGLDTRAADRDRLWDIARELTADGYETLGRWFVYNEAGFIPTDVLETDGSHDYGDDELLYVASVIDRHDQVLGRAFRLQILGPLMASRKLSYAEFLRDLAVGKQVTS